MRAQPKHDEILARSFASIGRQVERYAGRDAGRLVDDDPQKLTKEQVELALSSYPALFETVSGFTMQPFQMDFTAKALRKGARLVVIISPEHGKTVHLVYMCLWILGNDPTETIVIASNKAGEASETLVEIEKLIEGNSAESKRLHQIFPKLRPAENQRDKWNDTKAFIEGAKGRTPSIQAVGARGTFNSSRITRVFGDDMVNKDHIWSPTLRERAVQFCRSGLITRLMDFASVVMFQNAWHVDDAGHVMGRTKSPCSACEGKGCDECDGTGERSWDVIQLPAGRRVPLADNDTGEQAKSPGGRLLFTWIDILWPKAAANDRFGWNPTRLEERWWDLGGGIESRASLLSEAANDEGSMFKGEWFEQAFALGEQLKAKMEDQAQMASLRQAWSTASGVDLGTGRHNRNSDLTAVVSGAALWKPIETADRAVLDVRSGLWDGPDVLDVLGAVASTVGDTGHQIFVEDNGAQNFILQFAPQAGGDFISHGVTTTGGGDQVGNKWHPKLGLGGLAVQLSIGRWAIIDSEETRAMARDAASWKVGTHTPDRLMAFWILMGGFELMGGRRRKPSGPKQAGMRNRYNLEM